MTVTINYFAWLRERTGISSEEVDLPPEVTTIKELMQWLGSRGDEFSPIVDHSDIIQVAINQQHCQDRNASLEGANEIALFPPMTGC